MAIGSQKAQGLPHPVTSLAFISEQGHALVLLVEERRCLGIHKVGLKHLFQYDGTNRTFEMTAFCCLDFYVHESQQRKGLGLLMFEAAEKLSGIAPRYWAFDKPSPKLFAFLQKHYAMDLRPNFAIQVSKFAMSEEAIQVVGGTYARILRDQKLGRVQFDKITIDPIQMVQNQLQLLVKYLPGQCLSRSDQRLAIPLPVITLEAYRQEAMQKSIQVQKIQLETPQPVSRMPEAVEDVPQRQQTSTVRLAAKKTGFW